MVGLRVAVVVIRKNVILMIVLGPDPIVPQLLRERVHHAERVLRLLLLKVVRRRPHPGHVRRILHQVHTAPDVIVHRHQVVVKNDVLPF